MGDKNIYLLYMPKSTQKRIPFLMNNYYKKMEIVNGKIVEDIEILRKIDEKGQSIEGHIGNKPIHIRKTRRRKRKTNRKR